MTNRKVKEQLLKELIEAQKALEERVETQEQMIKRFQIITSYEDLFVRIIDYFPYPIMVFSPDGTLEMVNNALLYETGIKNNYAVVNKYNIFSHSAALDTEIRHAVKRALSGETVFLFDLKAPLNPLGRVFAAANKDKPNCYDTVFFPIKNNGDQIHHAVVVLIEQKL